MYEKIGQAPPTSDYNFYVENSNGKPVYTYMAYSSDDRGIWYLIGLLPRVVKTLLCQLITIQV